jgi:hypothetical protein
MKKKNFLMGLYVAVIYGIVIFSMTSCGNPHRDTQKKTATEVVNHSDKDIIIETLHLGYISRGVYKITVDSNVYVVVSNDGTAIIKHN